MALDLLNKTQQQKVLLKGAAIVDAFATVAPSIPKQTGYFVEILEVEQILGGVQVLARGYFDGKQLGFGIDGSVDIERFRIFNPPILVPDPSGPIVQTFETNDRDGNLLIQTRALREDPYAALVESLLHTISLIGKEGSQVLSGKVGNTTSTFYSAAGAVSPVDGYSGKDDSDVWSTTRNATDGNSANNTSVLIEHRNLFGNGNGAGFFTLFRAFHLFDTSSIPDADIISSATLSIFGNSKTIAGSEERLVVVSGNPASNSTISTADYDQAGAVSFGETGTTFDTTAYNNVTLNASGLSNISLTGITKFGIKGYYDFSNTTPTATADMVDTYYAADQTGTINDPKLVIEHTAANTGNFFAFM